MIIKKDYRKQASLTILNLEALSLDSPLKTNFGETASTALSEIFSFLDLLTISKKHFQLSYTIIPGQETQFPRRKPINIQKKLFMFVLKQK